jgi:predicted dehydrogenase
MDIPFASFQFLAGSGKVLGAHNPFYEEIKSFLESVRERKAPPITLQDARAAIEIMIAVQRSIVLGKPIDLPLEE